MPISITIHFRLVKGGKTFLMFTSLWFDMFTMSGSVAPFPLTPVSSTGQALSLSKGLRAETTTNHD
jgi:hypothetical protein